MAPVPSTPVPPPVEEAPGRHPAAEVEEGPAEVRGVDEPEEGDSIAGDSVIRALEEEESSGDEYKEVTEQGKLAWKFFKCPVSLNLLREPMVFGCGHITCRKCSTKWIAARPVEPPICPLCKISFYQLPRKCELIGGLVQKLRPRKHKTKETSLKSNEMVGEVEPQKIELKDVTCCSCKGILYKPSVLNCGHVFCIPCVLSTAGTTITCEVCGALHSSSPNICVELNGFIKTYFPSEYKAKAEQIQLSTSTSSLVETMNYNVKLFEPAKLSETHVGVGCDSCGIYPIQGNRYSCKTCKDFDLCEECLKMSNVHGRSGQLHSINHVLELNDSYLFHEVLAVLDEKAEEGGHEGLWEAQENEGQ